MEYLQYARHKGAVRDASRKHRDAVETAAGLHDAGGREAPHRGLDTHAAAEVPRHSPCKRSEISRLVRHSGCAAIDRPPESTGVCWHA